MEILGRSVNRDELCGLMSFCGLNGETHLRCSTLFLAELYMRMVTHSIPGDPAKIIAEVKALEGTGQPSSTKEASAFRRKPLRGLWHKHYLAEISVANNIMLELGGPEFPRLLDVIKSQRNSGAPHFTLEDVPRLANSITDLYMQRAKRKRLTGEWIIFAKYENQNYYLCLGSHLDDNGELCNRVRHMCMGEFPFLDEILNR